MVIKEVILAVSGISDISATAVCQYPLVKTCTTDRCNAAQNRNRGWEKVTGDWIVFLDADDFYHPDKIRVTYETILANPEIECVVHSFKINDGFNARLFPAIKSWITIAANDIFSATFPSGVWEQNSGTNIFIPKEKEFHIHHGIATVKASSSCRYNETYRIGEDGHFCRQHVLSKKLVAIDANLMIYNKACSLYRLMKKKRTII